MKEHEKEPAAGDEAELEARLAAAEAKSQENWDLFLRARADLENYRRRVERDLEAMVRRGKRDFLLRLLDVVDAFDRAAAYESGATGAGGGAAGGAAGADSGLQLIWRQFLKVLADEGVVPIESTGQPFDPAIHEAIDVRADATVDGPTVEAELQRGYLYGGEVLRPARVRVVQPPL